MKRRDFMSNVALGLGAGITASLSGKAAMGAPRPDWRNLNHRSSAQPRGTARNLIFVFLAGGASHVDTFDLKTGSETPDLLGPAQIGPMLWPAGIMPKLAQMTDQFSVVRSITAVEAVHERATYHLTTAQRHDPSRASEVPHFASVMSHMLQPQRRSSDSLPSVVIFGETMAQNGFFPIEHRGITLTEEGEIPNLAHNAPGGPGRQKLLSDLLTQVNPGDHRGQRVRLQNQAKQLMNDTELHNLLGIGGDTEVELDESAAFRRQCQAVVNMLSADKGARVVQMNLGDWDHHINIYAPDALPALATTLDDGLSYLIQSLQAKPGKNGVTLLDETMIVAAGEFGRTTAGLNESAGRDHYPYAMSAFFAGGGVKGGRIIGATDATGSAITDPGWSQARYMGVGDLVATMYSALGLDWTARFTDTPSGRLFEAVPTIAGANYDIAPLFI